MLLQNLGPTSCTAPRFTTFATANSMRGPELNFKPTDQQHQFGFTIGGPIRRNRVFFIAGYDQHIFHEPTIVRFVNGANSVVPQLGAGPVTPGDYEADDQTLVSSPQNCSAMPASPSWA